MSQGNQTSTVTEFFIVGFPGLHPDYYNLLASAFFCIYVSTLAGNSLLVTVFVTEQKLQKPMYIIMLNLALTDVGFCTVALPKVIARYWFSDGAISFHVCLLQKQLVHYFGALNSLILLIMAFDRYLAICHPLRYPTLMTNKAMGVLNAFAWVSAMILPTVTTIQSGQMTFCGPNKIIHCYCDTYSLNSLSCGSIAEQSAVSLSIALFVLMLPFSLIILSYVRVIVAVLRIADAKGRVKMFSTCATQLFIISIYYIPRLSVHVTNYVPNLKLSADTRIALSLFCSLFPPLVNPLIYCFKTKEIQEILRRWFHLKNKVCQKPTGVAVFC